MSKRKGGAEKGLIKPINSTKPYEYLADQLREAILNGEIAEGESLPPERELVEQSGLSRSSVREALKMLAVEGFVEVRLGRFGGSIVTLPGRDEVASVISTFVKGQKFPLRQLQETREALEPALAKLAALHRTDDNVAELWELQQNLVDAAGNYRAFAKCNIDWHNAVAKASANELLSTMLFSISAGVAASTFIKEYDTLETRREVIGVHERITRAIEARDAATAGRLMALHIRATHDEGQSDRDQQFSVSGEETH